MEEIYSEPNIQAITWVLLAAFSQIYSGNQERTAELNDLLSLQSCQKGSTCKIGAQATMIAEKLSIKKKPGTSYMKKDAFRASQM